jgi:hypothetical protein
VIQVSITTGRQKWEAKMQTAGQKWDAAKSYMPQNWAEGLRAAGASPGPLTSRAYQEGISRISASDFQSAVSGKGDKWERNFLAGISR